MPSQLGFQAGAQELVVAQPYRRLTLERVVLCAQLADGARPTVVFSITRRISSAGMSSALRTSVVPSAAKTRTPRDRRSGSAPEPRLARAKHPLRSRAARTGASRRQASQSNPAPARLCSGDPPSNVTAASASPGTTVRLYGGRAHSATWYGVVADSPRRRAHSLIVSPLATCSRTSERQRASSPCSPSITSRGRDPTRSRRAQTGAYLAVRLPLLGTTWYPGDTP